MTGSIRVATAAVGSLLISFVALGSPLATNPQLPLLTSIKEVRSLSPAEAKLGYPVCLRATITYFDPTENFLFMQDATTGIWASSSWPILPVAAGDVVEVQAKTTFTDFAPDLTDLHLKRVGRTPLPVPDRATFEQLASTLEDSRWVEIEGSVREAEYLHRYPWEQVLWMDVAVPGGHIDVSIPWNGSSVPPPHLVDARVRIRGACGANFNAKRQLVGVQIYVPDLREVTTIEAPPINLAAQSPTPIGQVQRFGSRNTLGHRVKLAGIVTAVLQNRGFYLQDNSGSIYVQSRQANDFTYGDEVEILGFVAFADSHLRLEDGSVRRLRRNAALKRAEIGVEEAFSEKYDSDLVTLQGRIVGRSALREQQVLMIQQKQSIFPVIFSRSVPARQLPDEGSLVKVTGVCVNDIDSFGRVSAFKLIARAGEDVTVLQRPPWWTVRRALMSIAVLGTLTAVVLAWVLVLRRRVRLQTRLISRKLLEEEALKEAAEMASRSKGEFLANMSHELRTPMNAIVGFTDLLLDTPLTEEQRDYVTTVQFSSNALTRILNDVLDFSKIEAGELLLEQTTFSLRSCVERILQLIAPEANRKHLALDLRMENDVCDRIVGDPYRLHQVLLNLLGNAVKFTDKGSVTLRISCIDRSESSLLLQFTVADTGIGIPLEAQTRIFQSFHQGDGSTTRKYGGTGLGLAICSRLVSLFGGSIWVESAPGQGSSFHFTARFSLPAEAVPVRAGDLLRDAV
ncbi:MAG: hypothetical protein JO033_18985 [Acidobacteriaceae bacterium]|nr:hypothetical protein [Acidobacteriaceae bacterium]